MVLNRKRIHNPFFEISPKELNDYFQKFYLSARKTRRPFGHCKPKLLLLATVNKLKLIIFVTNYLTVLVYTKTIILLSVGG